MLLKCRDDAARELMAEAISAYHATAYRSAIIATWIAVFVDLASKIRSLSIAGDDKAQQWIKQYDKHIDEYDPNHPNTVTPFQKLETTILNAAKNDFQLITSLDLFDLKRLREDRHRCAHPAFRSSSELFSPNAEQARAHIRSALEHVLTKPAIRGDLIVERILEMVMDEGFPDDILQVMELLRSRDLADLGEGSFSQLIDLITERTFAPRTNGYTRTKTLTVLSALHNLNPTWFDSHFQSCLSKQLEQKSLGTWRVLVDMTHNEPWLVGYIGQLQVGRLHAFIRDADVNEHEEVRFIAKCLESPVARDEALKRTQEIPDRLLSLLTKSLPEDTVLSEGVRRLVSSDSWSTTYTVAENLLIPNAKLLSRAQITKVKNAIQSNSNVTGSYILEDLIRAILLLNDPARLGSKESWNRLIEGCSKLDDARKQSLRSYLDNAFSEDPVPL